MHTSNNNTWINIITHYLLSYQIGVPVTAFQLQPSLVQQNFLPTTLLSLSTRIDSFSLLVHDITPLCKKYKFAHLFLFT